MTGISGLAAVAAAPYADRLEHLEDLEREVLLHLEIAGPQFREEPAADSPGRLLRLREVIRRREALSQQQEVDLPFVRLCAVSGLDEFERTILLYLFFLNTSPDFRKRIEGTEGFAGPVDDGGAIPIEGLLRLACSGYRERIQRRRHFSIQAPLRQKGLILLSTNGDETTGITSRKVCLHERIVRFLLGDDNLYDPAFRGITRTQGTIPLSQVVLPEGLKEEILRHIESHERSRESRDNLGIDAFFGYGTGLALLFSGPSGTGKTVLAHAISASLGKPLFQVDLGNGREYRDSEGMIRYVFREAHIHGGIVFLDECDDTFEEGGYLSQLLLIELEKSQGMTILATNRTKRLDPSLERRISLRVEIPFPDVKLRRKIWRRLIPSGVCLEADVDFDLLARRYELSGGLIKNAVFLAVSGAFSSDGETRLSMKELDRAARLQCSRLFEEDTTGELHASRIRIDELPIHPSDRETLKGLASTWHRMREQTLGLNVVIASGSPATGLRAAEALAHACDLPIRTFMMSELMGTGTNFRHPRTRNYVGPMEYAFAEGIGHNALKVFLEDREWNAAKGSEGKDNGKVDSFRLPFLGRLRKANGFHVLVTRDLQMPLPPEFHFKIELRKPPESVQIREWSRRLQTDAESEDRIARLVESHPMHIEEIDSVCRQAAVKALVEKVTDQITLEDVESVLSSRLAARPNPILFGRRKTTC